MTEFKVGERVRLTHPQHDTVIEGTLGAYGADTTIKSAPFAGNSYGVLLKAFIEGGWIVEAAKPNLPTEPGSVIFIENDDFYVLDESGDTWGSSMNAYDMDEIDEGYEFSVVFVNKKIVEDAPVEDA